MNTLTQRHQVFEAIQALPDDSIDELANFIHYLQYKNTSSQSPTRSIPDVESILDPSKIYEVWTPIDAPVAAQTLRSLLTAQIASSNG